MHAVTRWNATFRRQGWRLLWEVTKYLHSRRMTCFGLFWFTDAHTRLRLQLTTHWSAHFWPGHLSGVPSFVKLLAGQNHGINIERWTARQQQLTRDGQLIVWEIDHELAAAVEADNCQLFCCFGYMTLLMANWEVLRDCVYQSMKNNLTLNHISSVSLLHVIKLRQLQSYMVCGMIWLVTCRLDCCNLVLINLLPSVITPLHHTLALPCERVLKATKQVNRKGQNSTPRHTKTP